MAAVEALTSELRISDGARRGYEGYHGLRVKKQWQGGGW